MGEFAVADPQPGARRQQDADALVLRTISANADGLLRLARRHSLCQDDAYDAYQRGVEIFLKHAHRLEPDGAASWLRTVVKHEAMAVRAARQRDLGAVEVDFDALEAQGIASPEDRALGADLVARSAEALQRLKPQELQALWLQAQGNSYAEIEAQTGWSRTKVNRCVYEGRQSFLRRFAGIESGAECERWLPVLSALVDGEATPEQLVEVRPHLRNCPSCRAVVRELHRAGEPLRVVLPVVPLAALGAASGAPAPSGHGLVRLYETITTWAGERAATGMLRMQAMAEGLEASAHKTGAVLAASAAVAGGGAVAIERTAERPHRAPERAAAHAAHRPAARPAAHVPRARPAARVAAASVTSAPARTSPAATPAPRVAAPAAAPGPASGGGPPTGSAAPAASAPASSAPAPAEPAAASEMGLE